MFVFTVSHILHELAIYPASIVRRDEFAFMRQKSVFWSFMAMFFPDVRKEVLWRPQKYTITVSILISLREPSVFARSDALLCFN